MTSVLDIPDTDISVVDGPIGSGHGFAIGLTCPVAAADTPYTNTVTFGFDTANGAYIGAGVTDMLPRSPGVPNMYSVESSTGWFDPLVGGPFDGGTSAYGDQAVIAWSPNFGLGVQDRPLGVLLPVCKDNARYSPSTPLQGFHGPSAMILGGSECLANAHVITLNSSTGNQSVTGIGFQPDFLLFLGCEAYAVNVGRDGTNFMVGVAGKDGDGNLSEWVGCTRSQFFSSAASKTSRWHNDACIAHIGAAEFGGATTVNQLANIVSFDADGYTINLSAAGLDSASVASNVVVLAVKVLSGNGIVVGNGVQGDTVLNNPAAPGWQPDTLLFASSQNNVLGTDQVNAYFNLGATDALLERSFWAGCDDLPVDSAGYVSTVSSMRWATALGLIAEANATLTGTGASLNWTTDDVSARYFGWVAFQIDSVRNVLPGCVQSVPQIYRRVRS